MKQIGLRMAGVLVALSVVANMLPWLFAVPFGSAFAASLDDMSPTLAPQTSREGNVTVTVTPRNIAPGASSWDFEVKLETHTQPLDQDMTGVAVLIDTNGKSHVPVAWDGSPAGGHHRRGLLRFRPLAETPATMELRIQGIGGVEVRVFRWQLK
ncbi:MAG TPA: hypothetical protein VLB06_05720 [Sulfuricaulis sp.]|nr:hypothetical protein [Sulfuricaulis sp.]